MKQFLHIIFYAILSFGLVATPIKAEKLSPIIGFASIIGAWESGGYALDPHNTHGWKTAPLKTLYNIILGDEDQTKPDLSQKKTKRRILAAVLCAIFTAETGGWITGQNDWRPLFGFFRSLENNNDANNPKFFRVTNIQIPNEHLKNEGVTIDSVPTAEQEGADCGFHALWNFLQLTAVEKPENTDLERNKFIQNAKELLRYNKKKIDWIDTGDIFDICPSNFISDPDGNFSVPEAGTESRHCTKENALVLNDTELCMYANGNQIYDTQEVAQHKKFVDDIKKFRNGNPLTILFRSESHYNVLVAKATSNVNTGQLEVNFQCYDSYGSKKNRNDLTRGERLLAKVLCDLPIVPNEEA